MVEGLMVGDGDLSVLVVRVVSALLTMSDPDGRHGSDVVTVVVAVSVRASKGCITGTAAYMAAVGDGLVFETFIAKP